MDRDRIDAVASAPSQLGDRTHIHLDQGFDHAMLPGRGQFGAGNPDLRVTQFAAPHNLRIGCPQHDAIPDGQFQSSQ